VVHAVADNRKQEGFCKRLLLEFTTDLQQTQGKNGIQGCLHITAESQ
jgi:hypothetical protein